MAFHPFRYLSQTLSSSLTLIFLLLSIPNLPENLVGSISRYLQNQDCSHHLYCCHHGVGLRHLWPGFLEYLNWSPCFRSCPAIEYPQPGGHSEVSARNSPVALHVTQGQSPHYGQPSPLWPGPWRLSDFISYSSAGTSQPYCPPTWASDTLGTLWPQGLLT